jgi:hypothetical protein
VLAEVYASDISGPYQCPRYVSVPYYSQKYVLDPYRTYGIVRAMYYYKDDLIKEPQIERPKRLG